MAAPDPLEMAGNLVVAVDKLAQWQVDDPVQAHIHQAGTSGVTIAQLAGNMALVSIARDLRRIADYLEGARDGSA